MNREAALLGVPVYSIFMGRIGAIDQSLSDHGRLTLIRKPDDVAGIEFRKRDRLPWNKEERKKRSEQLVGLVCDEILAMVHE